MRKSHNLFKAVMNPKPIDISIAMRDKTNSVRSQSGFLRVKYVEKCLSLKISVRNAILNVNNKLFKKDNWFRDTAAHLTYRSS